MDIDTRITTTEEMLLEEFVKPTFQPYLNEWERNFVNSILTRTTSEDSKIFLTYKQRFHLWQMTRKYFEYLRNPELIDIVREVLPVWISSYESGCENGKAEILRLQNK